MATLILRIEKEDVNTQRIGDNYMIKADGMDIVFTPDALDELITDYGSLKKPNTSDLNGCWPVKRVKRVKKVEKYWTTEQVFLWIFSVAVISLFICVCIKASL